MVLTDESPFGYFPKHSRSCPGNPTLYRDKMSLSPVTAATLMEEQRHRSVQGNGQPTCVITLWTWAKLDLQSFHRGKGESR